VRSWRSQVRRLLLGAYARLARSRWTRVCDARLVDGLISKLWEMSLTEVLVVLKALEAAGVAAVLAGGWGVDALLGVQTRRHADLDLFIVEDQPGALEKAAHALYLRGYRPLLDRGPNGRMPAHRAVFDQAGHFVDLLPLDPQQSRLVELTTTGAPFVAEGSLGGRVVRCIDAGVQLAVAEGVAHLPRRTKSDTAALRRLIRPASGESRFPTNVN
jgi:lincosamide nucleotidyltransferase A/C/D/E